MNAKEYSKLALKTANHDFKAIAGRFNHPQVLMFAHGALGCVTESAELLDLVKKTVYYDAPVYRAKVVEELGDILWYINLCAEAMGISLEEIMELNIQKLKVRYGEAFSEEKALKRDSSREEKVFSGKQTGKFQI